MGRPRSIDQNAVLDAAEVVVVRLGATHLTLDAVAAEAGISKASVIYDYKNKQQLIKAVLERCLAREEERIRTATLPFEGQPDATMHGQIAATATAPADKMRAVATNLVAALAQDAELHQVIEDFYTRTFSALRETASNARSGMIAFLALQGLKSIEWHDFHSWPEAERRQILRDITWLIRAPLPPAEAT